MLCERLQSVSAVELLAKARIRERIELETPQVVYIVACDACQSTHSIEFSIDDEPESLASLYKDASDSGAAAIVGAVALLALLLPISAYARPVEITTTCTCSVFEDPKASTIQQPLLTNAPLVDGTRISSTYGMRMHPLLGHCAMHWGVDFAAPLGTPVYATGSGVIQEAGRKGSYGNYLRIRHSATYSSAYAHLDGFAPGIRPGLYVRGGQIIGRVGTSGRSTAPHLHYEVVVKGRRVSPACRCFSPTPRHRPRRLEGARIVSENKPTQKEGL
jgi:murein DD-endopeptidase MepM/ murein hydrolase activator NlpD